MQKFLIGVELTKDSETHDVYEQNLREFSEWTSLTYVDLMTKNTCSRIAKRSRTARKNLKVIREALRNSTSAGQRLRIVRQEIDSAVKSP